MSDRDSIPETPRAGWLGRNVRLPVDLTLLFAALLLGTVWWIRAHSIAGRVESAGGSFHVRDFAPNSWARLIGRIEGRSYSRHHEISFWRCEVGDEWLREHREQLGALSSLDLMLSDCPVTDEGLQQLRGLNNITGLMLWGTQITDDGAEHIATMSGLQSVNLSRTRVTADGIERLSSLPHLRRLMIHETQLTGDDLSVLRAFPELLYVCIDKSQASEAGIANLRMCARLRDLSLHNTSTETVSRLAGWHELKTLNLSGADVNDDSIPVLAGLDGLIHLSLRQTSISEDGLSELRRLLPDCRIDDSDPTPGTR